MMAAKQFAHARRLFRGPAGYIGGVSALPTVPVKLRVHLAHATVQVIADQAGADVLHIKGPATAARLRTGERTSVDADVHVRPSHLRRLQRGLRSQGWQQVKRTVSGGLVEHSTNWYHDQLGQLDLHVRFPGIMAQPERAFCHLWEGRTTQPIAGHLCVVPGLAAQRLLLLLHAARALDSCDDDVHAAWRQASDVERAEVLALAADLKAEVALAAATGRLEQFRGRPEYELWRLYADGESTTAGFRRARAVIGAAPDGASLRRLRLGWYVLYAVVRMPWRLAAATGRRADAREIWTAYRTFLRRALDGPGRRP